MSNVLVAASVAPVAPLLAVVAASPVVAAPPAVADAPAVGGALVPAASLPSSVVVQAITSANTAITSEMAAALSTTGRWRSMPPYRSSVDDRFAAAAEVRLTGRRAAGRRPIPGARPVARAPCRADSGAAR